VIALVALYRPGPMDLIPDFIARKHGRERVEYLDKRLEPILSPTYGIMVYQEQVMQIAQVMGGYTLGGADLLRRAMGKKKAEEMAQQRDIFVSGAEKNGLSRGKATQLFDLMEKFAGYGFNRSHAAAYALLAYQTAYMKAHHPAAFMAANLSLVMDDTDKVRQFRDDALANGLSVLAPDINASEHRFVPVDTKTVRYGLGAVRGTGESAVGAIVAARRASPLASLADVCRRVDKRIVNRRALEALIRGLSIDSHIFRPATFIEMSLANLYQSLLLGSGLVILVLAVFLNDWRTAVISIVTIPLSLLTAALALHYRGGTLDTMVLAGLLIALGEVVDDAIIDVENILRRLRLNAVADPPASSVSVVLNASLEVRSAVVYGSLIVALVLMPVLLLDGLAGSFFRPLALSYILAIVASLGIALTLTPALALILLPRAVTHQQRDNAIVVGLKTALSAGTHQRSPDRGECQHRGTAVRSRSSRAHGESRPDWP
jgi:hypothetical protein